MLGKSRSGFNSTGVNMVRVNCMVCNQYTMLVAANGENVEHAQCGNRECKSNKPEVSMKAKIQKLLNIAVLSPKEVPDILEFVSELIDLELQYDLEKFPNATRSHEEHRKAFQIVRDLEEFFNEHYKNTK